MKLKLLFCLVVGLATHASAQSEASPVDPPEQAEEAPPAVVVEPDDGEPDPFGDDYGGLGWSSVRKLSPARRIAAGQTVLVRVESYDVKTPTVIALLDAWEVKKGADLLRGQVLDLSKTGEAEVADLVAATVEAGATHTFESILEYIYPTEYDYGGGLEGSRPQPKDEKTKRTLAELLDSLDETLIPQSFETRNTGTTLEFHIQGVESEKNTWDVSLAPESVEVAGILEWGVLGAKMPQFTSFRSSTVLRVRDGEWSLVCTQTPRDDQGAQRFGLKRMVFLKVERAR